jgi:hypothetical protein
VSKWHFILFGGQDAQPPPNDSWETVIPPVNYTRHGCWAILWGILFALLAPLVLLPSSLGTIPYEYSRDFLALSGGEQYVQLLWKNGLVVLKGLLHPEYIRDISLPKPPDSSIGYAAVVAIAALDLGAIVLLTKGAVTIYKNAAKWKENH